MISAYATGTAMLLSALPSPPELTLVAHGRWQHPTSKKRLNDARKLLEDTTRKNKIHYQLVEVSVRVPLLDPAISLVIPTPTTNASGISIDPGCLVL